MTAGFTGMAQLSSMRTRCYFWVLWTAKGCILGAQWTFIEEESVEQFSFSFSKPFFKKSAITEIKAETHLLRI